eukprot:171979-Chlamydomonas_euryale.AAC.4
MASFIPMPLSAQSCSPGRVFARWYTQDSTRKTAHARQHDSPHHLCCRTHYRFIDGAAGPIANALGNADIAGGHLVCAEQAVVIGGGGGGGGGG